MFRLMATEIIQVDESKAREFLSYNTLGTQRKLNRDHVRMLAVKHLSGLFRTGEIGIATNGADKSFLVNGQHQCEMVISTGVPIVAKIERYRFDTPDDLSSLFRQYDTHLQRSLGDAVKVERKSLQLDIPDRLASLIVSGAIALQGNLALDGRLSLDRKVKSLEKYLFFVPFAERIFLTDKRGMREDTKHMRRQSVIAVMIESMQIDYSSAYQFWVDVRDGENLTKTTPQYHLREFLMVHYSSGSGRRSGVRLASGHEFRYRCAHAWNLFRKKTLVKQFKYSPDSEPPKLI